MYIIFTFSSGGAVQHQKIDTYREREKKWREQAANLSPGAERDACLTLAQGYANLITILERLETREVAPKRQGLRLHAGLEAAHAAGR
jgi:hypothetical protein